MHVISRRTLWEAAREKKYAESAAALDAWYRIAKAAKWKSLQEVKQTLRSADGVTVGDKTFTVFNIAGNQFRLITRIVYPAQRIYIKHVLTHAEYDREEWKKK